MQTILVVAHLFLAIGIVTLVLVQHGKGADAGAAFGSGASATVFGARGSTSFLSRSTGILAALFFASSMALAYYASQSGKPQTLMDRLPIKSQKAPVTPEQGRVDTSFVPPAATEPVAQDDVFPVPPAVIGEGTGEAVPEIGTEVSIPIPAAVKTVPEGNDNSAAVPTSVERASEAGAPPAGTAKIVPDVSANTPTPVTVAPDSKAGTGVPVSGGTETVLDVVGADVSISGPPAVGVISKTDTETPISEMAKTTPDIGANAPIGEGGAASENHPKAEPQGPVVPE